MGFIATLSQRRIGRLIMAALAAAAGFMMAEHILPEKASGEDIGERPDIEAQERLRQPAAETPATDEESGVEESGVDSDSDPDI